MAFTPGGALSRAQPPGEPQATEAALSIADEPEETDRLTVSEEDTAETTVEHTT